MSRRKLFEWIVAGTIGNAASDMLKTAWKRADGTLGTDPTLVEAALSKNYQVSVRISETMFHHFVIVLEHTGRGYLIKASQDLGATRVSTACAEQSEEYVLLGTIILSEHNLSFDFDFSNIAWLGEHDEDPGTASI